MEVTCSNFQELLPQIKQDIYEADFTAIDSEFSGLGGNAFPQSKYNELDTPNERYLKCKRTVEKYGWIQFGLSTFRLCMETSRYLTSTYCFYLRGSDLASFMYDSSSMKFLADNGFNFNKVFKDGLTFITLADEAARRQKLTQMQNEEYVAPTPLKLSNVNLQSFYEESKRKVGIFVNDPSVESLTFPSVLMSPLQRKILFNNIGPLFPEVLVQSTGPPNRDIQLLKFKTVEEKKRFIFRKKENELDNQVGFSRVVQYILEAEKPIVGHNLFLDLLHLVHKTISSLPESLDEFKTLVQSNLPIIYDTKLLAKDPPFCEKILNSSLGDIYRGSVEQLNPPAFDAVPERKSYTIKNKDCGQDHDAGFDSFMTGVAFASFTKSLDGKKWYKTPCVMSKHLAKYKNRINFMQSHDILHMDLYGPDEVPDRSHIYAVEYPAAWTNANARTALSPLKNFHISWVDSTHLYAIPLEDEDIQCPGKKLSLLRASCPQNVFIAMYSKAHSFNRIGNGLPLKDAATKSPAGIGTSKRKSGSEVESVTEANHQNSEAGGTEAARSLKRLKSVGSTQLSNMTLDSPMMEEKPFVDATSSASKGDISEVFACPDEW